MLELTDILRRPHDFCALSCKNVLADICLKPRWPRRPLRALRDPARRPPEPLRPLPPAPASAPASTCLLRLSKTPCGQLAAGLSGANAEHYKLLLAGEEGFAFFDQFAKVTTLRANGNVPAEDGAAERVPDRTRRQE